MSPQPTQPNPPTRYPIEKFPAVAEAADSVIAAARAFARCYEVQEPGPGQRPSGAYANQKLQDLNDALAHFDALAASL